MASTVKEEKTIKEWLMMLKEPYRSQTLENTDDELLSYIQESIEHALSAAFLWYKSPQGEYYWRNIRTGAQDYIEPAANTVKEEAPQLPIPRRVMVKEYRSDDWHEAELIANLTQFGIEESNHPFAYRDLEDPSNFILTGYMMEIEDYNKMVEPKKPMSFGEFAMDNCHVFDKDGLSEAYGYYQQYLKTFEA